MNNLITLEKCYSLKLIKNAKLIFKQRKYNHLVPLLIHCFHRNINV